jgi:hypothetical protein
MIAWQQSRRGDSILGKQLPASGGADVTRVPLAPVVEASSYDGVILSRSTLVLEARVIAPESWSQVQRALADP